MPIATRSSWWPWGDGERLKEAPFDPLSVIDPRIDVAAQLSLMRMANGDPSARSDALGMLDGVKRGSLSGIFGDDLRAAAMLAGRLGTVRWELVPPGRDAAVIRAPGEPPTIIFREQIRGFPARVDLALRSSLAELRALSNPPVPPRVPVLAPHPVLGRGWIEWGQTVEPITEFQFTLSQPPQPVRNPSTIPHRWTCWLSATYSFVVGASGTHGGVGTGFLISPRHILTAGHILFTRIEIDQQRLTDPTEATSLTVIVGRNGAQLGLGPQGVLRCRIAPGWAKSCAGERPSDVALVTLKSSLPETYGFWGAAGTGTVQAALLPGTPGSGTRIATTGYPGGGCGLPVLGANCGSLPRGTHMYSATSAVRSNDGATFLTDLTAETGQSGSPVWMLGQKQGLVLAGIAVSAPIVGETPTRVTEVVPMNLPLTRLLRRWMDEDKKLDQGIKIEPTDVLRAQTGSACRPKITFQL